MADNHKETNQRKATGGPKVSKLKRHQVSRACQPCAKAKRKCDGQRPCQRCREKGITDQCADVVTRRQKTKRPAEHRMGTDEERSKKHRQQINNCGDGALHLPVPTEKKDEVSVSHNLEGVAASTLTLLRQPQPAPDTACSIDSTQFAAMSPYPAYQVVQAPARCAAPVEGFHSGCPSVGFLPYTGAFPVHLQYQLPLQMSGDGHVWQNSQPPPVQYPYLFNGNIPPPEGYTTGNDISQAVLPSTYCSTFQGSSAITDAHQPERRDPQYNAAIPTTDIQHPKNQKVGEFVSISQRIDASSSKSMEMTNSSSEMAPSMREPEGSYVPNGGWTPAVDSQTLMPSPNVNGSHGSQ